jgi:hypothetical protein
VGSWILGQQEIENFYWNAMKVLQGALKHTCKQNKKQNKASMISGTSMVILHLQINSSPFLLSDGWIAPTELSSPPFLHSCGSILTLQHMEHDDFYSEWGKMTRAGPFPEPKGVARLMKVSTTRRKGEETSRDGRSQFRFVLVTWQVTLQTQ